MTNKSQLVTAGTAPRLVKAYRTGKHGDGIIAVLADGSEHIVRKSGGAKYGLVSQVNAAWRANVRNEQGFSSGYSDTKTESCNYFMRHRVGSKVPAHVRKFPVVAAVLID